MAFIALMLFALFATDVSAQTGRLVLEKGNAKIYQYNGEWKLYHDKEVVAHGEGVLDINNLSPTFKLFLDMFAETGKNVRFNKNVNKAESATYGPLLKTAWNQSPKPYNHLFPLIIYQDQNGQTVEEHPVVGCVTVSSAQILNYFRYCQPIVVNKQYANSKHEVKQFSDYCKISNVQPYGSYWLYDCEVSYTPDFVKINSDDDELSKFMLAIAMKQGACFGKDGTGTSSYNQRDAFSTVYGYDVETYDVDQLDNNPKIANALKNGIPLIIAGGPHSFILDGYNGSEYHIDYGWGGHDNCWMTSSAFETTKYGDGNAFIQICKPKNSTIMQSAPKYLHIVTNGTDNKYDLSLVSGLSYKAEAKLAAGTHNFYFEYADGSTLAPYTQSPIAINGDNTKFRHHGHYVSSPAQITMPYGYTLEFVHNAGINEISISAKDIELTISGTVLDASGKPVANAIVTTSSAKPVEKTSGKDKESEGSGWTFTKESNTFIPEYEYLTNIEVYAFYYGNPGNLKVYVTNDNNDIIWQKSVPHTSVNTKGTSVVVDNGLKLNTNKTYSVVIEPENASTSGNLYYYQRAADKTMAYHITTCNAPYFKTGSDGKYSISVTNPFNGKLYALVDGTEFTPLSFNNATTDLTNKDFKPGTSSTVTISGKILDENSNPISPAEVSITADKSGTTVKTDADGNYNIEVSKNFTGKLYAFANGYTFEPLSLSNVSGNLVGKDLKGVSDFVTVSGLVYNATNTPVADATVSLNADKSNGVKTSANGSYSIKVSKNYSGKLYAFAEGIDFDPVALTTTTKDVSGINFTALTDFITVSGKVMDGNGTGIAGAYVSNTNQQPSEIIDCQNEMRSCYVPVSNITCPLGSFTFTPNNRHITSLELYAQIKGDPESFDVIISKSGQKVLTVTTPIEKIRNGIARVDLVYDFEPGTKYKAEIVSKNEFAQDRYFVFALSTSGSELHYKFYSMPDGTTKTDANGNYSVAVKRNSKSSLYAFHSKYEFEPVALSATDNNLKDVNISGVSKECTISGKVLDKDSKGVANILINNANRQSETKLDCNNELSDKYVYLSESITPFQPSQCLLKSIEIKVASKGTPGNFTISVVDVKSNVLWQKEMTTNDIAGYNAWTKISFGEGIPVVPSAEYFIIIKPEKTDYNSSDFYGIFNGANSGIAFNLYSSAALAVTDKDGNYSVSVKRGSDITLYALSDNISYAPLSFTKVDKNLTDQNFVAPIVQIFTVYGNAVYEDSYAIEGAKVSLDGKTVTTNDYGAFSFTVEEGFSGKITATAEGFTFDPVAISNVSEDIADMELVGKEVKQTVTISGTVTDESSEAISGAKVSINDLSATTDNKGAYYISVEKGTSGIILVSADGYSFTSSTVRNVAENKTMDFTGKKVVTTATISGKVVDEKSKGISGATVSANGKTATTDANGAYSLVVSLGFSGKMSVTADGYEFDPVAIRNVNADKTQHFIGKKIDLVSYVTISGKVLDESGKAISDAQVSINGTTVTTDKDGKYSISVEKGYSGNLTASADDYAFDPISITATANLTDKDFKGKKSVQFVTISGKVSDNNGSGINGAKVSLTEDGEDGKTVETNYFGSYSIAVESGYTGSLYATANGYTFEPATLTNVTANTTKNFKGTVEYITVSGNVYDEDNNNNIVGANVYFKANNGGSIISTTTDANGNYSMQIPKKMAGVIYPVVDGYVFAWECRIIGDGATADKTDVDFAGTKKTKQFTISGTVTDHDGDPLSSVQITFRNDNYTFHDIIAITDDNGEYSITVAEGSKGTLSAIAEGYTFANQTISIEDIAANSEDNDFVADENEVITNPIIIYGIVTDENNEPIEGATISLSRYGSGQSVKSEANGSFELPVAKYFSGRIYASAKGYRFESQSVYNVTDHITDIAFVGTKVQNTVNITIYAIDKDSYEYLEDVVIYLNSDKQGTGYTSSPDFEGDPMFTIPVEKGTPVTLYAFADGYTFEPLTIDNPSNMTSEDIFGTTNGGSSTSTKKVCGWVSDDETHKDLKGATISITGNQSVTATTNRDGYFEINIPSDYTGKLYATLSGYKFEPVDIDSYVFIHGTESQPTIKTTTIFGWAWDMATEKDLKGVVITIADNNDVTATTDYEGYFEIEIPDTYKGKLYAALDGYNFEPQDIDPEGVFFEGTSGQVVQKTFTISGTVRTEDYDVIAGAEVSLTEDKAEGKTVKTDEDGEYTIEVPEGFKGKLYAFAVGYTFEPLTFSRGVFRDLTGKDFDGVKSNETVTVSGKVTDEKGKALAEAIVSYLTTNGDGESVITGKNGSYTIKVPKNFTGKLFASYISEDEFTFEPISLENVTANITGKDFKATKTSIVIYTIIEGKVWDNELVGIAGATVSTTPDKAEGTTVTTDERGNFIFQIEGSFTGTLYAFADGFEFEPITLKNVSGSLQDQIFIGEVVSSNKTVTISGKVVDRDFYGVAGAEVYTSKGGEAKLELDQQRVENSEKIYWVDDSPYDDNYTVSDFTPTKGKIGKVEFKLWKEGNPGTVSVAILNEDAEILWEKALTAKDVKHNDWTAVNLDLAVTPGDTYYIVLKSGKSDDDNFYAYYDTRKEDGMQYKIYTLTGGESKKSVTTDSDGNYVFEVENGADVTLYAYYDGLEFNPLTLTNVKRDLTDQDFYAIGAAPAEEKKYVTITGKVLDEKSQPIAGALISSDAENATLDCSFEKAEAYVEFDEDDEMNETYFIPSGRYLSRVDFMIHKEKGAKANLTVSILDVCKNKLWSKTISTDAITSEEWTSVSLDKSLQFTPGEIYNLRLSISDPTAEIYYVVDEKEQNMVYRIWTIGESSVVSGADGSYSYQVDYNASGVLHAYFGDYNFNAIEYANITANATGKDFKAVVSAVKPKKDDNGNGNGNGNGNQTPVSSITKDNAKVWSFDRNVVIETEAGSEYKILDISGRTISASTTQSTHDVIAVNKTGIFVILVNGNSYKVFIQ